MDAAPAVQFRQATPFLHVEDVDAAAAFFRDLLGFKLVLRFDDYAYLHRDQVGVRMLQLEKDDPVRRLPRRFTYYFDVADVDALFAELAPRLTGLPPRDVHGPADKPYGQRELIVVAPDGGLLIFGQAIAGDLPAAERGEGA